MASISHPTLSKWGGLLAALATTEDFIKTCSDDPDMKLMVDTVKRLEASLKDCALHGPQSLVDAFIACQLTPTIVNRWNSPVLDGLWQVLSGRTPDGATPLALNPPHCFAEAVVRLVFPKAYPEAVDLVLGFDLFSGAESDVLAPAIVASACTSNEEILERLLAHSLGKAAQDYIFKQLPRILACASLKCCEIIFPRVVAFGSHITGSRIHPMVLALHWRASVADLPKVQYLLSRYQFDLPCIEGAIKCATEHVRSRSSPATFKLLWGLVEAPSQELLVYVLNSAALYNRVDVAQHILTYQLDAGAYFSAGQAALERPRGKVLPMLLPAMQAHDRLDLFYESFFFPSQNFEPEVMSMLFESVPDHRRLEVQSILDGGLAQAVTKLRPDLITWFLHHGANARACHDYIIYLAALSGRADVMELLLGAADLNDEQGAQYPQRMIEPAGLLGIARQLRELHIHDWQNFSMHLYFESAHELTAALNGGSASALEWITTQPTFFGLHGFVPISEAVTNGTTALVRVMLDPRFMNPLKARWPHWKETVLDSLRAARATHNFEMIQLLFPYSLEHERPSLRDLRRAVRANDPFTRRYLFGHFEPFQVAAETAVDVWRREGIRTLMNACMVGNLGMLEDVYRFVRCTFQCKPELFDTLGPRIDRALLLCKEGDLTPVLMVMMQHWCEQKYIRRRSSDIARSKMGPSARCSIVVGSRHTCSVCAVFSCEVSSARGGVLPDRVRCQSLPVISVHAAIATVIDACLASAPK